MQPTVILRHCPDYDVERIRRLVREGIDTLGLRPSGKVLVKPNVVAAGPFFPHAFTRPEVTEGVLLALRDRGEDIAEMAIGEKCGITVPVRYAFAESGYRALADRLDVHLSHFDEEAQVEIPLYHEGRLRDSFFVPRPVAEADFFVNCPKFKAHPWTTVTFSMKNYIGIQDERHRLIDHDHLLNRKVADLQYAIQPQLIVIDAVTAGEGRMLTPVPYDLGLVIIGNNQVAFDAVCCTIAGIDPLTVEHIRLAHERGFGPVDLAQIRIDGDVSLDAARERGSGFRTGLIRVEEYFRGSSIRAYGGRPPGGEVDYCWGGCPGAMQEAIEILRLFDDQTDAKIPPIHVVFGLYEGEIPAQSGEKVIFIGDCAEYHGEIAGELVSIPSLYVDRRHTSPRDARHSDVFAKMAKVSARFWADRDQQVIRMKGCPVSVAEQVLALVSLGQLKNPYLHGEVAVPFMSNYLSWRTRSLLQRFFGPYNRSGPTPRGGARPVQNLPPNGALALLEVGS